MARNKHSFKTDQLANHVFWRERVVRGVRVGGHDQAKVHEASEEDLVVLEYICDVLSARLAIHS